MKNPTLPPSYKRVILTCVPLFSVPKALANPPCFHPPRLYGVNDSSLSSPLSSPYLQSLVIRKEGPEVGNTLRGYFGLLSFSWNVHVQNVSPVFLQCWSLVVHGCMPTLVFVRIVLLQLFSFILSV